jgi:hypothetical protein
MGASLRSFILIAILATTLAGGGVRAAVHDGTDQLIAMKTDRLPVLAKPRARYFTVETRGPYSSVLCRMPIEISTWKISPTC